MALLRDKRKLAALNKENCEEHPRSKVAQNSGVPRSQKDYKYHISDEIEGKVTRKLSQEFIKTKNRILVALSRLDDFLMDPLIQGYAGTAPRRHGSHLAQTRERMRTTPRVILIPKQASSTTRRHETLEQKMATTLPKKSFTEKLFEDFERKNIYNSSHNQTTPWNTPPLNATIDDGTWSQEEINWRKNEKAFRWKLLEICNTRTKKSSPDMFILCSFGWSWHAR